MSHKQFKCYTHIPTFKVTNVRKVLKLIQQGEYGISMDLKDAYLHIPFVKHHLGFLWFMWKNKPYQWKVLLFGLVTAPRVFTTITKPFCSFAGIVGFLLYIWKVF